MLLHRGANATAAVQLVRAAMAANTSPDGDSDTAHTHTHMALWQIFLDALGAEHPALKSSAAT